MLSSLWMKMRRVYFLMRWWARIVAWCTFAWIISTRAFAQSEMGPPMPWLHSSEITYVVNGHAPTLKEISLYLYGSVRYSGEIAERNGLSPPYVLKLKQKLILKRKPTQSSKEGKRALLRMWREHFCLTEADGLEWPEPPPQDYDEFSEEEDQGSSGPKASEVVLEEGQTFFKKEQYVEALKKFRVAREISPDVMASWVYEIRSLLALNRKKEIKRTLSCLAKANPMVIKLPLYKNLQKAADTE